MEKRVETALLSDFYGPLLTPHQRDVLALYLEEDLSLAEVAERLGISRQGAHDALKNAEAQLQKYEQALGLLDRYQRIRRETALCRAYLAEIEPLPGGEAALQAAKRALERIDGIER